MELSRGTMHERVDGSTGQQMLHTGLAIVVIALSLTAGATPAAAQTGTGAKTRPADLNAYSLRFWPRNALQRGQTVRANTPYGVLTCTSVGPSQPRQCSLR